MTIRTIRAVLFDLDGTLLDTAPDLVFTLNQLRRAHHLPALPYDAVRPTVGLGVKPLLELGFNVTEHQIEFASLREQFLALYQKHLIDKTQLYSGMEKVLHHLGQHNIPWGIVTNKITLFTTQLLNTLVLPSQPSCVVCGDSLPTCKPDPEPILYACKLLKEKPENCIYIGDAVTDVIASKAAGTSSLVALYGYRSLHDDPYSWQADGYIQQPSEIMTWLS